MNVGDLVAGRFRIERLAGSGGMGDVYRASDSVSGQPVALKLLRDTSKELLDRFTREAELLTELCHPGIVRYVAHGGATAAPRWLAMEWLDGETLASRIERGPLTLDETLEAARQTAEALGFAHRAGVVHRDLKPSNLFLIDGALERVKILDFGIARVTRPRADKTRSGTRVGTPAYMAPEQARGDASVDARADVFALGCVIFRCLTGRNAFEGSDGLAVLLKILLDETPMLLDALPEAPVALADLVKRMLAKSPSMRPADGAEVAGELGALAARQEDPRAPESTRPGPPSLTPFERRPMSLVIARRLDVQSVHDAPTLGPGIAAEPALRQAIEANEAALDVLADGSMVVTVHAREAPTDAAFRAARAALALQRALPGVAIAVVSGHGSIEARLPAGEVIERAAQLAAGAAPGEVRLDASTARMLENRFELREHDGVHLLIVELEAARHGHAVDAPRTLLGRTTPFVGREAEHEVLHALLSHVERESAARAVLVTGAAGIGKSRLRYEFARALRDRRPDVELWLGRGDPMSAGSAFHLAAQAIRRAAGVTEGEPIEVRRRRLAEWVARHVAPTSRARVTAFVGELAGVPFADDDLPPLRAARQDGILMGDQIRDAWIELVGAVCGARTLVLVLEDMQWGDLPSVTLVDATLRFLRERPLFVLGVGRPDVDELFPRLWQDRELSTVRLGPLTRRASDRLVRAVLPTGSADERCERLVEHAGGNPFFLEELLRGAVEGPNDTPPETVLSMMQVRLASMEVEARRVLRAASVFGQRFWRGGIGALLGGPERTKNLDEWLDQLCRREVVTRRGETALAGDVEYVFRHALVRDAAYAMLTESDRELGHRAAAEWIEQHGERDAIALAEHFERGGLPERAAELWLEAAEEALEGNDMSAAVDRAERGARCGATGELLGELRRLQAEAIRWRGDLVGAGAKAREALDLLVRGTPRWFLALAEVGLVHSRLGEPDAVVALAEMLLADPDVRPSARVPVSIATAARLSSDVLRIGRPALTAALLAACDEAMAGAEIGPAVRGRVLQAKGSYAMLVGNPSDYADDMEAAANAFEEAGDTRNVCQMQINVGFALCELGAWAKAEQVLRAVLERSERLGVSAIVAIARNNLGWALAHRGRLAEARKVEQQAVDAFRAEGHRRLEGGSLSYLATVLERAGDLEAAEARAREAITLLDASPQLRGVAEATLARILRVRGRTDESLEFARSAFDLLERLGGVEEGEALVRLQLAESCMAVGDAATARAAIETARDRLLERASRIADGARRETFLRSVPEHARTLELAESWLGQKR